MSTLIETGIDYKKLNDMKYMRSYLMRLNDDLKYMLTNLGEDNFDAASLSTWQKFGNNVTELTRTAEELEIDLTSTSESMLSEISQKADKLSLCLTKGNVTSAINMSTDQINLSASRIKVTSDNFTINDDGLTIKGEIQSNAGNLGNFSISSSGINGSSNCTITGGILEGTNGYFNSFSCAGTNDSDRSNMWLDEATLNLKNCTIYCSNALMDGQMRITGDLNAADYNYSEGTYGARRLLQVTDRISCNDQIVCEKNYGTTSISNPGMAQVYSFITAEGYEWSDKNLKHDIKPLDEDIATGFISKLRPVSFNFIDDPDKDRTLGFIAQDVQALQDEYGDFGLVYTDEETGYMSLSYDHIVALMAAAMQKTERKIDGSD